jgi:hypothetical protein
MKVKIIQICAGSDGNLYMLNENGSVYVYRDGMQPGDSGQGRIYDGWTEGWASLTEELSQPIPHPLRTK